MDLEHSIGGLSKYQVWVIFLAGLTCLPESFLTQSAIYMSGAPTHRCAVPPVDVSFNLTENEIKELMIPYDEKNVEYDQCNRKEYNLTYCEILKSVECINIQGEINSSINCDNGYRYDKDVFITTPVSEWNLVCDRQTLDSLSTTLFFLGFFIGSFFVGPLSDWYGRKRALTIVFVGMFVSCILVSFMPNFPSYVTMRTICAAFTIASYIACFTYVSEISDSNWRTEAAIYINVLAGIAHTIYPWICYALKEWRKIHFVIALPAIPFFIILLLLPESPIWLLSKQNYDEAKQIFSNYSLSKGKKLDENLWEEFVIISK